MRDTVLLRSGPRKKSLPYVAKISALWEDPKTGQITGFKYPKTNEMVILVNTPKQMGDTRVNR